MDTHSVSDNSTHNPPASYGMDEKSGRKASGTSRGEPFKKKPKSKCLVLSKGYIRFRPGSTTAEKMAIRQERERTDMSMWDKIPKIIPDTWLFFNDMLMGHGIQLYGSQATRLFKNLPHAYKAFLQGDTSYYYVVDETKTQKVTLEVHTYKDKTYVSMKKLFKPEDKADDPNQDWIATGHFISFDAIEDDPDDMLDFVLMCNEK